MLCVGGGCWTKPEFEGVVKIRGQPRPRGPQGQINEINGERTSQDE